MRLSRGWRSSRRGAVAARWNGHADPAGSGAPARSAGPPGPPGPPGQGGNGPAGGTAVSAGRCCPPAGPEHRRTAEKLYCHVGRPLFGLLATLAIILASVVLVRLGNGDFSSSYVVTAAFASASAGLHPGSQVEERGVQIGSVRAIELVHRQAVVSMGIASQFKLPANAVATIEPQNLFGADQISISAPGSASSPGSPGSRRWLTNGSRITHTAELSELGQLFATADPLLSQVDTADLTRVMTELALAYGGQGRRIANSLTTGTQLASLLSRTTTQQLAALDAFTRFTLAIAGEGPLLNHLAWDGNRTLPLFNAARAAYAKLLVDLGTFGDRLAALLQDYRPQINTILDEGGNVTRVLLAQRTNVAQLVQGLATYAYRFAHGSSSAHLPDGSRMSYFKTFILWSDVQHLVCSLIAPPAGGLSYLEPLQQAILGGGSPLNCSSELARFDRAQLGPVPSLPTGSLAHGAKTAKTGSGGSAQGGLGGLGGGLWGLGSTADKLAQGLFGALGRPIDQPGLSNIGAYVDSLLP